MSSRLAIILVSYNTKYFLNDCLCSLQNQNYGNIQIIIVDNASPDNSNEFIEKKYPEVILLKESINHGFGGACNIGARYALKHGADYVLFLNTDTVADSNMVSELVKYSDSSTVTTCFTYNDKNNLNPWYSGGRLNKTSLSSEQTLYPYNPLHEPIEVSFISGCCMMIHKDVFSKVGFFDLDFFMYYEDAEYCARMIKNGIKLLYIQSTKLFHYEGGSQEKRVEGSRLAIYYATRNKIFLACRHPELLDIPVHEFIKNVIKEVGYFSPRFKYKVSYEKKGIEDFFKSVTGKIDSFDMKYSAGFWDIEQNEKNNFCHCMEKDSYIKLCNYSDSRKTVHLKFNILPAPTTNYGELDIFLNDKNLGLFRLPCIFDNIIEFSEQEIQFLKFKSRMKLISFPNDLRTFAFTIANISHTEASSIEITKPTGFYEEESDSVNHWNWVTETESELRVFNFSGKDAVCRVKFTFQPAPTRETGKVDIYLNDSLYKKDFCIPGMIDDVIKIKPEEYTKLSFIYKDDLVHIDGENRSFAFQLRNFECQKVNPIEVIKPTGFYEEESDSINHWNWVTETESELRMYNFSGKDAVCRVKFTFQPAPTRETGKINIYLDDSLYKKDFCIPGTIDDVIKIRSEEYTKLSFIYKDDLVHIDGENRSFAFQLRNFECTQIDSSLSKLRNIPFVAECNFAVYGTGLNAMRFCERNGMNNSICFFDGKKEEGEFAGKPILKFCDETLRNYNIKQIVIAASEKYIKEIYERISPVCKKNGINVYDVYDVDLDYKYTIENTCNDDTSV